MKLKTSDELIIGFSSKKWPNNNDWNKYRQERFLLNEKIKNIVLIHESAHESICITDYNVHYDSSYIDETLLKECILNTNFLTLAVSMVLEPYESIYSHSQKHNLYIPNVLLTSCNDYNL